MSEQHEIGGALLRLQHHQTRLNDCYTCAQMWPCDAIRILDALGASRASEAALREALEEIRDVQTGRYTTSKHPDEIISNIVARALAAATAESQGDASQSGEGV